MPETDEEKVRRYTDCLMNGIDPKRALKRLYDLTVDPEVYKTAETYKYVKRYETSEELAKYAKRVRDKLFGGRKRDKVEDRHEHSSSLKKVKKEEVNFDAEFAEAMRGDVSKQEKTAPRVAVDYSKFKVTKRTEVKVEPKAEPVDDYGQHASSSSSTSSTMLHKSHHQKDYAPIQPVVKHHVPQFKKSAPQSTSLHADENMFKPRKERQKVFAGRRRRIGEDVPSLISLCQAVLVQNVDMIDHVGTVPFELLEPALNQATTDQVRRIYDVNPLLQEDIEKIFHELVRKEFPKYADRVPAKTWRKQYDELVDRKNRKESEKLERLTNKIGKAHTGQNQGRQTMVIDMAHTRIRSKSFFNNFKDSQVKMTATPSAIQLSQARKNVKTVSEGKAQLRTITPKGGGVPQVSRSRSGGNNMNNNGPVVKKTAPLMAKCKKMLRR